MKNYLTLTRKPILFRNRNKQRIKFSMCVYTHTHTHTHTHTWYPSVKFVLSKLGSVSDQQIRSLSTTSTCCNYFSVLQEMRSVQHITNVRCK